MYPNTKIYDAQRQEKYLNPSIIGAGGEGEVYSLKDRSDVLVKIYHEKLIKEKGWLLEEKISAMREMTHITNSCNNIYWPLLNIYKEDKKWIGYAMYQATGKKMSYLSHYKAYKSNFPKINRRQQLGYLINMLKQIKFLHANNVMVGDYNINNFICNPENERVSFIDCDSYQINHKGKLYPCIVGSPDMTPKEHQNKNFSEVRRTRESEYFSIAIILFKCLMLGRHPYDMVGGSDPVTNLTKGYFPYAMNINKVPNGPWRDMWSLLPEDIKFLFIKTFIDGSNSPNKRATTEEWLTALEKYRKASVCSGLTPAHLN